MRALLVLTCTVWLFPSAFAGAEDAFRSQIAPVLERHCVRCHSGATPKGDVDLSSAAGVAKTDRLIVAGHPEKSLLIEVVAGESPRMPESGDPLTPADIELLTNWIADGATWPADVTLRDDPSDWWSLRPLESPQLPELSNADRAWTRTPIDVFIVAKLRDLGLLPSAAADRRTLIRRLSFDLTGLPPTPEEVERFVGDAKPQAYEELVEQLLASEQYGERWAQHWLDVVHYADTHGYDKDKVRPHAWPYRDYVIRALNTDKPYREFVREQLAGDRLAETPADGIPALGFIAAGPFDFVGQIEVADGSMEKQRVRNVDRDDMVSATINTFVSLTAQCARCHDHKFDPISQADYYSLQAVFAAVDRADRAYDVDPQLGATRATLHTRARALEQSQAHAPAGDSLADIERELQAVTSQLEALPPPQYVFAAATDFKPQGQHTPTRGVARPIAVLARGNEQAPLEPVGPGTIGCVAGLPSRFELADAADESDRRVALAEWIVDPRNPLTWRSIVNRVWQYHFGRGIVETPNDFGRMGAEPTHPELLDWLAASFRDGNQSLKELHRLIVTSAVYRQSSADDPESAAIDADNRYLWRMNRRRLAAEEIRDAVLAVSGKLRRDGGGPGFRAFGFKDDHSPHYLYDEHDPDDAASHRRSVYRFIVRSAPDPFLTTLDCADPSLLVERRNETITPLQALALLNNDFMVRMAAHLAERAAATSANPAEQIATVYRLALQRDPEPEEMAVLTTLTEQHGLANVCRLVLNMNEFVFVD